MNTLTLIIFIAVLFGCVIAGVPILVALLTGYILFVLYALINGFAVKDVLKMSFDGIRTAKNILITFMLIGIMTALWRAGGTVPVIVSTSAGLISPSVFVCLAFVLNCVLSFLTGTAFGTSATMGVICMTVAGTLGVDAVVTGGAVLAGAYFGDRCSPVSTSALLVSELTGTDIYNNIKNMLKTAAIPFLLSCGAYLVLGFALPASGNVLPDIRGIFAKEFSLSPLSFIPAAVILVLSLFKVKVKISMTASILASAVVCVLTEDVSVTELFRYAFFGFSTDNEILSPMINGGGIVSMLKVSAIVCISSCYSGIFGGTGLLEPVQTLVKKLKKRLSAYAVVLITSVFSGMTACNQTLSIMLTNQLCADIEKDKSKLALYLENSAVVIAPLVPWSIAGSVALTSAGAPMSSIIAAVFLYILPIYSLFIFRNKHI